MLDFAYHILVAFHGFLVQWPMAIIPTTALMDGWKKAGQLCKTWADCNPKHPQHCSLQTCANTAVGHLLVSHCMSVPCSKRQQEMHLEKVILALIKRKILDGCNYWICVYSNHLCTVCIKFLLRQKQQMCYIAVRGKQRLLAFQQCQIHKHLGSYGCNNSELLSGYQINKSWTKI